MGILPFITIWLVVSNMNFIFHFIYGIILPIDFHIFQDGFLTTNQTCVNGEIPIFHSEPFTPLGCSQTWRTRPVAGCIRGDFPARKGSSQGSSQCLKKPGYVTAPKCVGLSFASDWVMKGL